MQLNIMTLKQYDDVLRKKMGLAEENLRRKKQVQDIVAWKYVGFIDDGNPQKPYKSSKLDNVHETMKRKQRYFLLI